MERPPARGPHRISDHLDQDLADRAIEWITGHKSLKPDDPFMLYWASGSMHSPHHAPPDFIDRYRGKFDMGWDVAREQILANQKRLGVRSPRTPSSPSASPRSRPGTR